MCKIKTRVTAIALSVIMVATMTVSVAASSATITYTFFTSGSQAGITTTCRNFADVVQANAQVETSTGSTLHRFTASINAQATAQRGGNNPVRTGWAVW